ncbi:MAG: NADP-dependent oxidoreductase [Aquincola sp.]|nr:NADP-dependent oxidoreductase [Aquincola sp.]MDH5330398.1 NADP-dependent oxidoreductase [Aquincola sp.]
MNNRRIVLAARPTGEAGLEHFRLETLETPPLADGQVLVRNHWLSLDPYMRMRMNAAKNYAAPVEVGEVMVGGTAGEIVQSRHADFAIGETVVCQGGWQECSVIDANVKGAIRKVDIARVPLAAHLGAVGMPGVTAWIGLDTIIEPKAGETVLVDAASGAVGGVVGQLAKERGCRTVGIAGGAAKCAYVRGELGFDACIDYHGKGFDALAAELDAAAPNGVDGLFENVGGLILDVVLSRMNAFGRIALCGMIAGYDGAPMPIRSPRVLLTQRLRLQGFIVTDHMPLWPAALKALGEGVAAGRIRYRETIAPGLQSAPEAFLGLLKGRNFGKQLVKLR